MKEKIKLTITKLGNDGEGIADFGGKPIFVYNTLPGERVLVKPFVNIRNHFEGKLLEIKQKSPFRQKYPFVYPNNSVGMNLIHMKYDKTVKYKNDKVMYHFRKKLTNSNFKVIKFENTIPAVHNLFYRYDTILPLGQKEGKVIWGMYEPQTNIIMPTNLLLNQTKLINEIANKVINILNKLKLKVFHQKTKTGFLRFLKIRQNLENQIELCLVIYAEFVYNLLVEKIKQELPEVIKFSLIINQQNNPINPLLGKHIHIFGPVFFQITVNNFTYNLSTESFFQLNLEQTETLNREILKLAKLNKEDLVIDGYSGVGAISTPIAPLVKEVMQVEINTGACIASKKTIENMHYQNLKIINSDFEKWYINFNAQPHILIVDPPRKGLTPILIKTIKDKKPDKIIYVSCEIETLARDLQTLQEHFTIERVKSLDMFPYTPHVETIALLTKK